MTTSIPLPAWFKRWNQYPTASGEWVRVKLPAHERATLLSTQKAFAELMAFMPKEHPNTEGKRRAVELRARYRQTRDAELLKELDQIGEKGEILTNQLRTRIHAIRDAGRKLPEARGCRPIYAHTFRLAAAIVLQRLAVDERDERQSCTDAKLDFTPSEFLWSLANLAGYYGREAEVYGEKPESIDAASMFRHPVPIELA